MLSPQFYTLRHERLLIRFSYQAKKLAPSILENLLPPEGKYEYAVFKEREGWVFIAYDHEEISRFLKERGVAIEKIGRLYFAQQAVDRFERPVRLDENEALASVQHTATVVPLSLLSEGVEYQGFSRDFRPSGGKTFGAGSRSIIDEKSTWILTTVFLLFALMFTVEGLRYRHVIRAMQGRVAVMLKDYPSLQSAYSRNNIARKYRRIDKEERHKREVLKGLSRLMLPGVELETLLLEKKHFSAELKCPDEKTIVRLLALAKERGYGHSRVGSEKHVKIEGKL